MSNLKKISLSIGAVFLLVALLEVGARIYVWNAARILSDAPDSAIKFGDYQKAKEWGTLADRLGERLFGQMFYYTPYIPITVSPNYRFKLKNLDYSTNSLGFRGENEVVMPKPKDVYRVFMLGGSTVQGQFNEEWTIPYYLEKNLAGFKNKKIEVINAGVGGGFSQNELSLLQTRIFDLGPDLVIVFDGRNDLAYSVIPGWKNRELPYYKNLKASLDTFLNHQTLGSTISYAARYLAEKSTLLFLLRSPLRVAPSDNPAKVGLVNKEAVSTYIQNLNFMKAALDTKKINGLLIFQPTFGFCKNNLSDYENTIASVSEKSDAPGWLAEASRTWPEVAAVVRKIGDSSNVKIKDLSCAFKNFSGNAYLDTAHYDPAGDKEIAAQISEFIRKDF